MRSSYSKEDVTILLKDITGLVVPMENKDREKRIQSGTHYSEMIPCEHSPSEEYLKTFYAALEKYAKPTAKAVEKVSEQIYKDKGKNTVLVSLARAGTPIGILIKRYIKLKYGADVPHYTISIIRGRGIDENAMNYILERHPADAIQFVDGWTGKGAIQNQLREAMARYKGVDDTLAVLSDPAYVSGKCGSHCDFLIPSSCLNSTVSGLISRTFLRNDIIKSGDFHGALYYEEFEKEDLSVLFLDTIEKEFGCYFEFENTSGNSDSALQEVKRTAADFSISDINFVKPGIGETTRVLLRRMPWKILVHSTDDYEYLGHIYQLAKEKDIPLVVYPLKHYKSCGLIKNLSDA